MQSLWSSETKLKAREPLKGDMSIDTAVIGGGMAGLLIAYFLNQNGIKCAVFEARKIASGQTKNTTAKITCQHGLKYHSLIKDFGITKAKQYAQANLKAIDEFERIIKTENISCGFERLPSYLYTQNNSELLLEEAKAARLAGIPELLTDKTSLPFRTKLALKFENQAQFDPLKFIEAISKDLDIYENTMVKAIENNNLVTDRGIVSAGNIVVATHFPFINTPGYYFMRMHQERSYVVALENTPKLDGMYYGIDRNGLSFRNSGDYLLLGGGSHRTGENPDGGKYSRLETAARHYYPHSKQAFKWSAQDCMPLDGVPYIGRFSSSLPNVYVATGFQKWGMSSSMISAMIISEMIAGGENPYEIFSPQRFKVSASAKALMNETGHSVKGLSKNVLRFPDKAAAEIPKGHGGIVEYKGKKVGVYKDEEGKVYAVSNKCPHLGCQLEWNPDEKSWDCPCHGSRFDYRGRLIDNPAMRNLSIKKQDLSYKTK